MREQRSRPPTVALAAAAVALSAQRHTEDGSRPQNGPTIAGERTDGSFVKGERARALSSSALLSVRRTGARAL